MAISDYDLNKFNTRDLVLNVMAFCARQLDLDIHDNDVAMRLYYCCCDLESFPEGEGFGSSDHWCYVQRAEQEFGIEAAA